MDVYQYYQCVETVFVYLFAFPITYIQHKSSSAKGIS